jgi:PKD repeat protein
MTTSFRHYSHRISLAVGLTAVLASGCTIQEQTAPALSGPSELGLALTVVALPETLPRDGSSMSSIVISAFDANGKPKPGQRMILSANAGTLNPTEVLTGTDGKASATYIAPGVNERVSTATITAIPVGVAGGDASNVNVRTVRIVVLGPSIPFASFSFSPTSPAVLDPVTFDASGSSLDGPACGSACSYSWDFGDGSSGSGLVLQHTFTSSGVFNVTLTTTSLAHGTSNSTTRPVVIAAPALPVADFTTGPCAVAVARCFRFTDASTVGAGATITGHLIDFGDNTNANALPAERTYAVAGTYTIRLTVTDSLGRTATTTRPLVVP